MDENIEKKESPWMIARRGIKLLLNDKNKEAEVLFITSPPGIQITAGICFVTFMNALMCFDDRKVTEAISQIKKIEEECYNQIGWMKSFKNKIFTTNVTENKSFEESLEEKIVLADSLVCQSFLTFLHNDFASYMKGGWTLRRAWKVYQNTYEQLSALHKQKFGSANVSGWSTPIDIQTIKITSPSENLQSAENDAKHLEESDEKSDPALEIDEDFSKTDAPNNSSSKQSHFYSCSSKTFSEFSAINKCENICSEYDEKCIPNNGCDASCYQDTVSSVPSSTIVRPKSLHLNLKTPNGNAQHSLTCDNFSNRNHTMQKSVSLFSSLNSFSSAILESASSLIGFNKEPYKDLEDIDSETILRLMSAVSFGYGVFRLCVSLAPPSILRWINMLGFEGDQNAAIKSLHFSRKGTDMRAPLASLALLWYHTIVCPFFNVNGNTSKKSIEEAAKILEEEVEYKDSALFLFFKGRVERLKPDIQAAIEAYKMSVSKATLPEVKLLSLHEVGWCHLLTLDFKQAYHCFFQLKQQSKWSKSFYAYLTTICAGAMGNVNLVLSGKNEIKHFLEKSSNKGAQIEKYICRRMEKLPEANDSDSEFIKDTIHWQLYCFEMLYLWNTFPSCKTTDLHKIVEVCLPNNKDDLLKNEPMVGIGWLIQGSASLVIANRSNIQNNYAAYLSNAVDAFRLCLKHRSKCSEDAHVSAFAQYELALLLLKDETTRPEGKSLLAKLQYQYKDYDFEHRLNIRVNSTLKSLEKYESQRKPK